MACDLCGKDGVMFQVRIEGTVMTVCSSCARHGDIIRQIPSAKEKERKSKTEEKVAAAFGAMRSAQETMLLVVDDYAPRIKKARERLGLKQEDMAKSLKIKESQLQGYETGSHKPDLETARMLEKALRIKLVEEHVEEHAGTQARRSGPFTLGDFVKTRKK